MLRQGDVLLQKVDGVPEGAVVREGEDLVLFEGEASGHTHAVLAAGAPELFDWDNEVYVSVVAEKATLVHDEHGSVDLEKGVWRAWRQRQYDPSGRNMGVGD